MYLEILNFILILVLLGFIVYLGWQIYESGKEPKLYTPPEFDSGKESFSKGFEEKNSIVSIQTLPDFTGFITLSITSSKPFEIDWGNGLLVNYQGSTVAQKLIPFRYFIPKQYTILIYSSEESLKSFSIESNIPKVQNITYQNFSTPPKLLSNLTILDSNSTEIL